MVKHVLGISGGKDSAALAIYLNDKYPDLDVEYYSCDTGKELKETYELIDSLEIYLGKKIRVLKAVSNDDHDPFDHFLATYGGYLPSNTARWCTKKLKLMPFEKYIAGEDPIVSYVGIRGDEDREGYISTKENIQSIFPFRKNIWSKDVMVKFGANANVDFLKELAVESIFHTSKDSIVDTLATPITKVFPLGQKIDALLDIDVVEFNKLVFQFLQTTAYPLSKTDSFPLIDNSDILGRSDIFDILRSSGVGIPSYYERRSYKVEINGVMQEGFYSRSRSGCFFCFFQQKIEWVWLFENHRELFEQAKRYEKDGYSWQQGETLEELSQPARVNMIKEEHFKRRMRQKAKFRSPNLIDILGADSNDEWEVDWEEAEGTGCAACFI